MDPELLELVRLLVALEDKETGTQEDPEEVYLYINEYEEPEDPAV